VIALEVRTPLLVRRMALRQASGVSRALNDLRKRCLQVATGAAALLLLSGCKPKESNSLEWPDRRPIGALFLARDNTGWRSNPRGWFNDEHVNVTTSEGRQEFRKALLAYADQSIQLLREMNAQGVIVWDIEGQQFPLPNPTYVGNPEMLAGIAPEMDAVADEFFRKFTNASFKVGVLLRPQHLEKKPGGYEQQEYFVNPIAIYEELDRKINYARKRWNCSLFYIDSNFGFWNLGLYDIGIFERLHRKHPDVLLIPEFENASYFSCCAPYYDPAAVEKWPGTRTPAWENYSSHPKAFSVVYTGNINLKRRYRELLEAVRHGNILLYRGWWHGPEFETIKRIYAEAQAKEE
jgi:hypothetical protein